MSPMTQRRSPDQTFRLRIVLALLLTGLLGWVMLLLGLGDNGWAGLASGVVAVLVACVAERLVW